MKKIIAMFLALLMVFTAFAALAEEEGKPAPMYATVGEALDAPGYATSGNNEDYFSVITLQDGTYYRHIAYMDEKAKELYNAISTVEIEEMEAAFDASDDYNKTLPIAYSEAFLIYPMPQEDLDALAGKTIGDIRASGFESYGTDGSEEDGLFFVMRYGLFEYEMVVNVDAETFLAAVGSDDTENASKDFVVTGVKFHGINNDACMLTVHTDGTIEEQPDPFADMATVTAALMEKIQAIANGEEVDLESFAAGLKEQYPDIAGMIDSTLGVYKIFGAEAFISMMNSAAEGDTAPQE